MKRLAYALLLLANLPVPALGQVPVVFADGSASVTLPAGVSVVRHDKDLLATFGNTWDSKLELSFDPLPLRSRKDARDFVRQAATKAGSNLQEGGDRVVFMSTPGDIRREGKTYRVVHWQVGVRTGVFVLTATARMPASPEFQAFLGKELDPLVASLEVPREIAAGELIAHPGDYVGALVSVHACQTRGIEFNFMLACGSGSKSDILPVAWDGYDDRATRQMVAAFRIRRMRCPCIEADFVGIVEKRLMGNNPDKLHSTDIFVPTRVAHAIPDNRPFVR